MEDIFVIKTADQTIADTQQIPNCEITLKNVGIKFGVQKGKTPIFTWHFDLNSENNTSFDHLIKEQIKNELIMEFNKRQINHLLHGFSFTFVHITFNGGENYLPLNTNYYNDLFN